MCMLNTDLNPAVWHVWALGFGGADGRGGPGRRGRSLMDTVQSEVIQSPCGTLEAAFFLFSGRDVLTMCVFGCPVAEKNTHTHTQRVESQDQTLEVGSGFTTGAWCFISAVVLCHDSVIRTVRRPRKPSARLTHFNFYFTMLYLALERCQMAAEHYRRVCLPRFVLFILVFR